MAYEKQTWKTGDIVSSEKLNHMEDGIANLPSSGGELFDLKFDLNNAIIHHTYDEIKEAIIQHKQFINSRFNVENDGNDGTSSYAIAEFITVYSIFCTDTPDTTPSVRLVYLISDFPSPEDAETEAKFVIQYFVPSDDGEYLKEKGSDKN